jgi:hypothetical protein
MSDMDKGAFTRNGYTVEAGAGGSFVVYQGGREMDGYLRRVRGFTVWQDLITWLTEEHRANGTYLGDDKAGPPTT